MSAQDSTKTPGPWSTFIPYEEGPNQDDFPLQHSAIEAYLSTVCEGRAAMQASEAKALAAMIEAASRGEISHEEVRHIVTTTHMWLAATALEIPLSASYNTSRKSLRALLPKKQVLEELFFEEFSRLVPMTVDLCMGRK